MDQNQELFKIFPWNKNFEVGIELIDQQHQTLVEILNKLAMHLSQRSDEVVLSKVFSELADYAHYHFQAEEEIWSEHFKDDISLKEHQKTHSLFMEEVTELYDNKENKPLDDVIFNIVSFLAKWLAYHILDTDTRMAKTVKLLQKGESLQEAKAHADNEMNSSQVMVDTVLSMYDSLSTRTLDLLREKSLRLKAEASLQKSEERWKFILEGGVENVWDWDIENSDMQTSDNKRGLFDIVNKGLQYDKSALIHPADIDTVKHDLQAHLDGKSEFYVNKHRVLRDQGGWAWILSRGKVVSRNEDGTALRMVGTHTDVTERELAALIFKNSSQAVFVCDANHFIISVNPTFTKITGYQEKDVLGKNPSILASGEHDSDFYDAMWAALNSKGSWQGEIYDKKANGEVYPLSMNIKAIYDTHGELDYYFTMFHDLSKEKQQLAEKQRQEAYLIQQSRMAQMGEMISMIAHQWRQPLSAITSIAMNIKFKLLMEEGLDEETKEYFTEKLNSIDNLVKNLSIIVDDFRTFYKPNKALDEVRLSDVIMKTFKIIGPSLKSDHIEIIEHYNDNTPIFIYENEMIQVILNILKNAHDNFKDKNIPNPKIEITSEKRDDKITLNICDNGGGIPEDILTQVFDPYFSTKDQKNGTGLGLYMSKKIVEDHHNGLFSVHNQEDGCCFNISIKI
jgi:hemerythrin-like metal-binding protein/PAS domain S-box-containing protein